MDETLNPTHGTAPRNRSRRQAILVAALTATMLVVPMLARGADAGRPASIDLAAAPVPAVEGGNAIPIDDLGDFIVEDLNAYWTASFASAGLDYYPTAIVYFEFGVETGCGTASAEIGPFYCPVDYLVYLPLEFFVGDIRTQDFAVSAVIAHEVGHHVQNLVGISAAADVGVITSVQQELQADCLAGVWTADIGGRGMLEQGDYEEALVMFASIGDDAMGVPEGKGDHGSSEQRVAWYDYGFVTADGSQCVTY